MWRADKDAEFGCLQLSLPSNCFLFLVILGKGLEDRETGKVGAQMWGV